MPLALPRPPVLSRRQALITRYKDLHKGQDLTVVTDDLLTRAAYRGVRLSGLLQRAILHDTECKYFNSGPTNQPITGSPAYGGSEEATACRFRFVVSG